MKRSAAPGAEHRADADPPKPDWLAVWTPIWTAIALIAAAFRAPLWLALPCALLCPPLLWLGWRNGRGANHGAAHRGVVFSVFVMGLAVVCTVFGVGAPAWAAGVFAAATFATAIAHSYKRDPAAALPAAWGERTTLWHPKVVSGACADLLMSALWEGRVVFGRKRDPQRIREDLLAAGQRYREAGWDRRPEAAFATPPPLEKVQVYGTRVAGEAVEHLRFDSEFEAFDPEIRDDYAARRANQTGHVIFWRRTSESPRPVLISLHGYGMGRPAIDLRWLRVRGWDMPAIHRSLGIDVAYFVLPLHGPRAQGRSGRGFLDDHPLATTAAVAQSIWDLRRFIGWLRAAGAPAIGLQGISLGGYVTALYASLDRELACAMPTIPAVDLAPLVWRHLPGSQRSRWRRGGVDVSSLREAWALHAPLSHRPLTPSAARLLIAAFADRITPPSETLRLWEHWERPDLYWYPGTHLVWRGRTGLQMRAAAHLREFLPESLAGRRLSRFR